MKNKKIRLPLLVLVLVLILGGAYILYDTLGKNVENDQLSVPETNGTDSSDDERTPAPDFTVYDKDGNEIKLSQYKGNPLVLNFWASWCPPCKSEMPDFQKKYEEVGTEVQFLMINSTDGSRETVETATDFLVEMGYTFPVMFDTKMNASSAYGVYSLPTTYFIDADGNVVAGARGALSAESLQRGIDMIRNTR